MRQILTTLLTSLSLLFFSSSAFAQQEKQVEVKVVDGKVIVKTDDGETQVFDLGESSSTKSSSRWIIMKQEGDGEVKRFEFKQDEGESAANQKKRKIRVAPKDKLQSEQWLMLKQSGEGEGQLVQLQPMLGAADALLKSSLGKMDASKFVIGVQAVELPDALRSHLEIDDDSGLLIEQVFEDSPADGKFQAHDIILRMNGEAVDSVDSLVKNIQVAGKEESKLEIVVLRKGREKSVVVQPNKRGTFSFQIEVEEFLPGLEDASIPGQALMLPRQRVMLKGNKVDELAKQIEELRLEVKRLSKALDK